MTEIPPTPAPAPSRERWILLSLGCLCLVPFVVYHGLLGRLFWFGDEFDLVDQIDRLGFWTWLGRVFAENFVPLFKLLWGGGVLVFHGSYAAMIGLVWLTHAANVVLLGRVMRRCGLSWVAVVLAQVVFGLTPGNYETLAWSVQWSAVLSATCMLAALDSFFRAPFRPASFGWAAASALTFSRGVLTGPLLALGSFWQDRGRTSPTQRAAYLAGCLLPAVGVALLIIALANGNHHHMRGHLGDAAVYGIWYYCLNPAHYLLSVQSMGWHTVVALGLGKFALVGWSLARGHGRQRLFFALLVAFDLGNAFLLGIGRFNTGLLTTLSSRYQYASLIGIVPLAGFWFSTQWGRLPAPALLRSAFALALIGVAALLMCRQWSGALEPFTAWRGTDSRRILLSETGPNPVPGFPGFPIERARTLIAKYHLH